MITLVSGNNFIFIFDGLISLGIIYVLFAAMFKFLPNASIPWRSVKIGAAVTAVLFLIGKYLLAIYFGALEPGSTYGAAGSIILIMLWGLHQIKALVMEA